MKSPPSKRKAKATSSRARVIGGEYKAFDNISLDDAAKLIAPRIWLEHDDERSAEDRARKRVTRATLAGNLPKEPNGTFCFGYVIDWARNEWPGKFGDLPAIIGGSANGLTDSKFSASVTVLAPSLEVCQERLNAAQQRIEELENEVAGLRPDAEKWRAHCWRIKNRRKRE